MEIDGASSNSVQGNFIGLNADGTAVLGNQGSGVILNQGASGNMIGGTVAGSGNVISGSTDDGVAIINSGTTGNVVQQNVIGTDYTGVNALGNGGDGVDINSGASNNSVIGNIIAFSTADGVQIGADYTDLSTGNNVEGNSIHDNGYLGIGFGPSNTTLPNDSQGHSGPNLLQNYPAVTSAQIDANGDLIVTYADPANNDNSSTFPVAVDFYIADATGQGQRYIATDPLSSDPGGNTTVDLGNAASLGVSLGDSIVATATDGNNNTSEFSPAAAVTGQPTTFVVTNTNDSGAGSLRQAVHDADYAPGSEIDFDPSLTGTIVLTSGELDVTNIMTIVGPGADILAVSGDNASRVFDISQSVAVAISGLTIEDGNAAAGSGGGVFNSGDLTLTDVTVSTNSSGISGGGIDNAGTLTLNHSTVSNNNAANDGGGVMNEQAASLTITDSTIAFNTGMSGAGIYDDSFATLSVASSTISDNTGAGIAKNFDPFTNHTFAVVQDSTIANNLGSAVEAQGSVDFESDTIAGNQGGITFYTTGGIGNTILADNGGANLVYFNFAPNASLPASLGYNLSDDGGDGILTAPSDQTNTNPLLGPLQDNGGPTQTMALLPGSPALGTGNPSGPDQRGFAAASDVGAFQDQITVLGGTPLSATEGQLLSGTLTEFLDADPNAPNINITAVINWGDGTFSTASTSGGGDSSIFAFGSSDFYAVNASHTYAEAGGYSVTISITDADANSGAAAPFIFVQDAPLTAGNLTPPAAIEGQAFSDVTVFQFTDGNPNASASDFSAQVTLGDGNTVTLGDGSHYGQIEADGAGFDVTLSYTYTATLTNAPFSVQVNDIGGQSTSASGFVTVQDAPLTAGNLTPPTGPGLGTVSTYLSGFNSPQGLAFDAAGNLYVSVFDTGVVDKVTPAGVVTPFASIYQAAGMAFDASGNLYVASYGHGELDEVTPAGTTSVVASGFDGPSTVAIDPINGNLFVPTLDGNVWEVTPSGSVSLFASGFTTPAGLAFDAAGNLYVGNQPLGTISKVTPGGVVTPFASGLSYVHGLVYYNGTLYAIDEGNNEIDTVSATGVVTPYAVGLSTPLIGIAGDAVGNLYVTNYGDNTVSEVTPPAPVQGQSFTNETVFHFTDADPNAAASDFTAVVTLGDGNMVTLSSTASANGQIVAADNGGFDVQLSYTYNTALTNAPFSVQVNDVGGSSVFSPIGSVTVAPAANPLVVTTTADSGAGSLRAAIDYVNSDPNDDAGNPDVITFNIPTSDPGYNAGTNTWTISPSYIGGGVSLPVITAPVTLDGWSQGGAGYTGSPLIDIDGADASGDFGSFGFNIGASNVTVRGFDITGFADVNGNGFGIGVFNSASNVWIYGNDIGTDSTGLVAAANGQGGIWVGAGTTNVLIGTNADGANDAAERNIISGNGGNGILIQNSSTTVAGNYIGLGADGVTNLGNSGDGIYVSGSDNTIGGATDAARNVISGNIGDGVHIQDVGASGNVIDGNSIGIGADGSTATPNGGDGVFIDVGATGNTIGQGNDIAWNHGNGVDVYADFTIVQGNSIGSNDGYGVGLYSDNNTVQGNTIGSTNNRQNQGGGLLISDGSDNLIGGDSALGQGNVISGNFGFGGVEITGGGSVINVVAGNLIGTDATGTGSGGNFGDRVGGVTISGGASDNTIGGTTAGARNIISSNFTNNNSTTVVGAGTIGIFGANTTGNVIEGDYIGTDVTGTQVIGNFAQGNNDNGNPDNAGGILIADGANENIIGGTDPGAGNVISGNFGQNNGSGAIEIIGAGTDDNTVAGNIIGLDASGTTMLGNYADGGDVTAGGVFIGAGASDNTVGGSDPSARNIISGNFGGNSGAGGVQIDGVGTSGNIVAGNYIGTDISGTNADNLGSFGGLAGGVAITGGATNNTIGGTDPGAGNLFAQGYGDAGGVAISGAGTSGNFVQGNLFGVDYTGTTTTDADGNGTLSTGGSVVIVISAGATNNVIGGDGAGNLISGGSGGVTIEDADTSGNQVLGNTIGTDITGTLAVDSFGNTFANRGDGVLIRNGATDNTNGGAASDRNIISNTYNDGIHITDAGTSFNFVLGNYIGVDATGTFGVINLGDSIQIENGASSNTIGGTDPGDGNVLGATFGDGVDIDGIGTSSNVVLGNYIGVNAAGTAAITDGEYGDGVQIHDGATNNTIGGTIVGAGNVISGSLFGDGVEISDAGTTGNVVQGNFIGTDFSGTMPIGNGAAGVNIHDGAQFNLIGADGSDATADALARNIISGNSQEGVRITDSGTSFNVVAGNYIGADVTGEFALGNGGAGVSFGFSPSNNRVGTDGVSADDAGERNVISGNAAQGIHIGDGGTSGNLIAGNYIGLDAAGTKAIGNGFSGILLRDGADGNTIGWDGNGNAADMINVISGNGVIGDSYNGQDGIRLTDSGTSDNTIDGNYIGTDYTGTTTTGSDNNPLGNAGDGVILALGASANTIGGSVLGAGNVISGNAGDGVEITGAGATGNMVEGNYIGTNAAGTAPIANAQGVVVENGRVEQHHRGNHQHFPARGELRLRCRDDFRGGRRRQRGRQPRPGGCGRSGQRSAGQRRRHVPNRNDCCQRRQRTICSRSRRL